MQHTRLGATGLEVSRICLGCMSFGVPDRGGHTWTLDEDASRPVLARALELGVNFLDTANVYSDGTSEEIVGRALRDLTRREDVVLATKVHGRMRPGPNGGVSGPDGGSGPSPKVAQTGPPSSSRRPGAKVSPSVSTASTGRPATISCRSAIRSWAPPTKISANTRRSVEMVEVFRSQGNSSSRTAPPKSCARW